MSNKKNNKVTSQKTADNSESINTLKKFGSDGAPRIFSGKSQSSLNHNSSKFNTENISFMCSSNTNSNKNPSLITNIRRLSDEKNTLIEQKKIQRLIEKYPQRSQSKHGIFVLENLDTSIQTSDSSESNFSKNNSVKVLDEKVTKLKLKFLDCIMSKDFLTAKIKCEKILNLCPNEETVIQFKPLIEESISLQQQSDSETSSNDISESENNDDEETDENENSTAYAAAQKSTEYEDHHNRNLLQEETDQKNNNSKFYAWKP